MVKIGGEDEDSSSTDEEEYLTPNTRRKRQSAQQPTEEKSHTVVEIKVNIQEIELPKDEPKEEEDKEPSPKEPNKEDVILPVTKTISVDNNITLTKVRSAEVSLVQRAAEAALVDPPLQIDKKALKHWNQFDRLPDELLMRIYGFVDIPTIGRLAQVCKRFYGLSGDLAMWKQQTIEKGGIFEGGEVTKSYYIRKFKNWKEAQRRREEEEKRQRLVTRKHQQEEKCGTIMNYVAFNRIHEWVVTVGLLFVTIAAALKLDGHIHWNWAAILVPFYFIIFQMIYAPLMYDIASMYFDKDFEDRISDDHKYCGPIFYLLFFMMPLGNTSDLKKRSLVYGTITCVVLFLILLCVKVAIVDTTMGWWAVFLPILIQCCIFITVLIVGNYDRIWEDDQWIDRALPIVMTVVFMLAIIFISLKLDDAVTWSWYFTLIPLFILQGLFIVIPIILTSISACASYWIRSKTRWSDETSAFCTVAVVVAVLLIGPLLTLEILLAQHAEGANHLTYALMFIPLFILEGCGVLGCGILNFIASSD